MLSFDRQGSYLSTFSPKILKRLLREPLRAPGPGRVFIPCLPSEGAWAGCTLPVPPGGAAPHSWTVASRRMEGVRIPERACGPGAACSACAERRVAQPSGWSPGSCSRQPHVALGTE